MTSKLSAVLFPTRSHFLHLNVNNWRKKFSFSHSLDFSEDSSSDVFMGWISSYTVQNMLYFNWPISNYYLRPDTVSFRMTVTHVEKNSIKIFTILLEYVHLVNGLKVTNLQQPRVQTVLPGRHSLLTLKKWCGRNRKGRLIEACEENASIYLITP